MCDSVRLLYLLTYLLQRGSTAVQLQPRSVYMKLYPVSYDVIGIYTAGRWVLGSRPAFTELPHR